MLDKKHTPIKLWLSIFVFEFRDYTITTPKMKKDMLLKIKYGLREILDVMMTLFN